MRWPQRNPSAGARRQHQNWWTPYTRRTDQSWRSLPPEILSWRSSQRQCHLCKFIVQLQLQHSLIVWLIAVILIYLLGSPGWPGPERKGTTWTPTATTHDRGQCQSAQMIPWTPASVQLTHLMEDHCKWDGGQVVKGKEVSTHVPDCWLAAIWLSMKEILFAKTASNCSNSKARSSYVWSEYSLSSMFASWQRFSAASIGANWGWSPFSSCKFSRRTD